MIKHYCDRCGAEISAESGLKRIRMSTSRAEFTAELCVPCWERIVFEDVPPLGAMFREAEAKAAARKAEKLKSKKEMENDAV